MTNENKALKELKQRVDDLTKVVLDDRDFVLTRLNELDMRAKTINECVALARLATRHATNGAERSIVVKIADDLEALKDQK